MQSLAFEIRRRPTFDAYMDDLFIMATTKPICEKAFNDAQEFLRYINVLWNDKTRPPAQTSIPMLGVEVDTLTMTISLPRADLHCADNFVMHLRWTEQIASSSSIQLKELYPIVLFVERYGYFLSGLSLPFGTDNLPNVYGVNKRSMRGPVALDWLVYLVDLADFYHILLLPTWIPREANISSKSISARDIAAFTLSSSSVHCRDSSPCASPIFAPL